MAIMKYDKINYIIFVFYLLFLFSLALGLEKLPVFLLVFITSISIFKLKDYHLLDELGSFEKKIIIFYFIIVIYSLIFKDYGYIERQVSYLLFPILGIHINKELLNTNFLKLVFKCFSLGLIVYPLSIIIYYLLTKTLTETGEPLNIFNLYEIKRLLFSHNVIYENVFHNTYYSIYSLCSIVFLSYNLNRFNKKDIIPLILILMHLFFIVVAASRITYIIIFLLICFSLFKTIFANRIAIYKKTFLFILFLSFSALLTKYDYLTYKFVKDLPKAFDFRVELWLKSFEIFNKNFFGVGFSNFHYQLNSSNGNNIQTDYNAHNLYLEYLCALGILGGGWFIYMLSSIIKEAITEKNRMLLAFLVIMCLSFITEAWLIRQYGILFFMFFLILLRNINFEKTFS